MATMKVPLGGSIVDADDIPIEESTERSSEYVLKDGTRLRVKFSVIAVGKIQGKFDNEGNPQYVINGSPTVAIMEVDEKLRRKNP